MEHVRVCYLPVWFPCLCLLFTITRFFSVLNSDDVASSAEPQHSWSQHGLPVTDICVGIGRASKVRVATVSLDQTCKVRIDIDVSGDTCEWELIGSTFQIFDLGSGQLLLSVMFDSPLFSIAMDNCEYHLFIGSNSGKIFRFNLYNPVSYFECRLIHVPIRFCISNFDFRHPAENGRAPSPRNSRKKLRWP